ncbi:MAG: hypothetical protein IJJ88_06455 [Oscillospiraceae bacterium]|nr:hypothetical protein [Oscillospiraceae bacterium]
MAEWEDRMQKILNDPGAMAQIMQMAQQLSGGSEPTPPSTPPPAPQPPSSASLPLDGETLTRLLPLVQELRRTDSEAARLLYALRPFLKEEKQGKVEQAVRLAHLIHVGKKAVTEWGLHLV